MMGASTATKINALGFSKMQHMMMSKK